MAAFRARILVLLAALTLLLVACDSGTRPSAATWRPDWQALLEVIPDQSELGDPPDESLCQSTLADVREQSEGLLPTPSGSIDELAQEWVSIAEQAFFDCPPTGQDIGSFDDAYAELRRVEESVETALADRE